MSGEVQSFKATIRLRSYLLNLIESQVVLLKDAHKFQINLARSFGDESWLKNFALRLTCVCTPPCNFATDKISRTRDYLRN